MTHDAKRIALLNELEAMLYEDSSPVPTDSVATASPPCESTSQEVAALDPLPRHTDAEQGGHVHEQFVVHEDPVFAAFSFVLSRRYG